MPENSTERPTEGSMLWGKPLNVINIGLELFGDTLASQKVSVVNVNWVPPAAGRRDILEVLDKFEN